MKKSTILSICLGLSVKDMFEKHQVFYVDVIYCHRFKLVWAKMTIFCKSYIEFQRLPIFYIFQRKLDDSFSLPSVNCHSRREPLPKDETRTGFVYGKFESIAQQWWGFYLFLWTRRTFIMESNYFSKYDSWLNCKGCTEYHRTYIRSSKYSPIFWKPNSVRFESLMLYFYFLCYFATS